jgi:hypothetical protein
MSVQTGSSRCQNCRASARNHAVFESAYSRSHSLFVGRVQIWKHLLLQVQNIYDSVIGALASVYAWSKLSPNVYY